MSLVPVADHLAGILAGVRPLPELEVRLGDALGHRLARPGAASLAVPPWGDSAMGGYAVRVADVAEAAPERPVTLRVVGDVPAGSPEDPPIGPGEAVRIMTGASLPTDADTVVQLEHTDRDDPAAPLASTVTVLRGPRAGMHVRRAGEDRRVGDPVAAAGTLVTGPVAAALASTGAGTAWVRRRPRVAVVATGSELVAPGERLGRGRIPDSNSLLLAGLVADAGAEVAAVEHASDAPGDLELVLARVVDGAAPDVVVLTGGVSQGAHDPVRRAFAGSDAVRFTRVAMQPGKPQAVGRLGADGPLLLGLPGNPVSVWVSFLVFARPLLLTLAGAPDDVVLPRPTLAVVETGWRTPGGRDQYLPARIAEAAGVADARDAGPALVGPAAALGSKSHLAASLAAANGYAIVPAADQGRHDDGRVHPGDVVAVVRLALELPHPAGAPRGGV